MVGTVISGRYDPQWTQPEYNPGGSRDALGIETLSESILADLLPGINNQTRRARYYSFWAWTLYDFIHDHAATHTQAGFYEWLRRREDTLILAYLAHGCGGGAAGTEQGGKIWAGGQAVSYPLDWKSLTSVDGGSYELYYRGPLLEMNIIDRSEGSPHDDLTKQVGLGLAKAYAEAVSKTRYVRHYLNATRLDKTEIVDFAQHGCLCRVARCGEERRLLIDAFFRFDSPDAFAVKRLASLCLFLDIVAQSRGEPLDEESFRAALYFWSFRRHAYVPQGNLLSPARRWRIFQLRQYFVYAVESFWSLFLHRIGAEALSGEEYLGWLLQELSLDTLAKKFGLRLSTKDARHLTLSALYGAVRGALPDKALAPGPAARQAELNEVDLSLAIRQGSLSSEATISAGYALLMLALIYWRCQPWRDAPGWIYATERYGSGRLPIEGYLRHVERAFREDWTLAHWLGWFHSRYLWQQHRRVVLEKMLSRHQDTAKFELLDDIPPDAGMGGAGPGVRFRGLEMDYPKTNAPRFPSALRILADLEIIEPLPDGSYHLCRDGIALLKRFRSYAVPEWVELEDHGAVEHAEEAGSG